MKKKLITYLKIIITLVIVALFIWLVILRPMITFKNYEEQMTKAAERYYELNKTELPTGSRIATVSMQTLYHKAYLKEDFYIPYTDDPCDMKASWVKVKKVDGKYKYYTYLKCGELESKIDNKGPEIKLNGAKEITLNLGDTYEELGVKSVTDNSDGQIKTSEVTIKSSEVNTSQTGTYEVTYTVADSLKNKTTVTRTVNVVSKLKNTVEKATGGKGYYMGSEPNNYVTLSGMLFRIIGIDGANVKIIADEDVANVNYEGISSWLDYYMKHFNDASKKLLVKNKYCNMQLTDTTLDTTECSSFTNKTYAYITSVVDINRSMDNTGSFLKPQTLSWVANEKDKDNAYATRNVFFGDAAGANFYSDKKINNYGVRPVLTVKGSTLIKSGDGTYNNPYSFGETKKGKPDDLINTRYSGEYINYGGILWRIVEVNKDGTTKIASAESIVREGQAIKTNYETTSTKKIYNPKEKGNVGYYINNKVSEYIDTSYFVNKNVEVPIYKKDILYGKETSTKKYKVKLSAPNMYEMFSAQATAEYDMKSYWLINSSNTQYYKGVVTDAGVVLSETVSDFDKYGIRVVGNLNKNVIITKGNGTKDNPYDITK